MTQKFIDYMESNDGFVKERDELYNNWQLTERAFLLRAPVREAEYAIDDWTPLRNFDCMIPQIKETRLFRIKPMSEFSMEDFKAQQKIKQLEWDLSKKAMPLLKAENTKQAAIIER